jgi:membrane protein DedA with SNARE-associated domain
VARWKERWQETFLTHARWVILSYHFLGYTRLIGPTAAGLLHLPYRRWAPLDYAGVTLWIIAFGSLGYVLGLMGLSLEDSEENVRIFEAIILFFVIAWFARTLFTSRKEDEQQE